MRTAACLALCSLVACASLGKKSTQPNLKPWPEIRPDVRVESLRARMYEYSITFAAEVAESPRFPSGSGDARVFYLSADLRHGVDRRHISEA